jgi:hypothetical protein
VNILCSKWGKLEAIPKDEHAIHPTGIWHWCGKMLLGKNKKDAAGGGPEE